MVPNLTAIERAFQIAKSGAAESMDSIRRGLKRKVIRSNISMDSWSAVSGGSVQPNAEIAPTKQVQ
jgi:hypothetical protein